MARTIQEIKNEMTTAFVADTTIKGLYELNPLQSFDEQFSKVSIESIIFYIVAVAIWSLENILDIAIKQQNAHILATKIHSLTWYSDYAKKFQYGDSLPWGEVEYDVINFDNRIVKFAAVMKVPGGLLVKIAGLDGDTLVPIGDGNNGTVDEFTPFKEYMFRVSAAGDNLFFRNEPADDLQLKLDIYYDPLVLNAEGERLDGSDDAPIQKAIDHYIKGIDFNGLFVPTFLVDELQKVEGVIIPDLIAAKYKYQLIPSWLSIPANGVQPFAGYMRINDPANLILNFIPFAQ